MKKFWVILLSLGLIMAFAMPAAAVDVKFSGSYYAQGFYVDNPSVLDKSATSTETSWGNNSYRGANAWYGQQFRLTTEFQVVEGLKLVTRFDAMEKRWGDQSWAGSTGETQSRTQTLVNASGVTGSNYAQRTVKAQENIEWERAYLDFNVPFGKFQVGYMQFLTWGTPFLNTPLTAGGIRYFYSQGPWQVVAAVEKRAEYIGMNASNIGQANDADRDLYDLGITYKFAPGQAGLLYQYYRTSQNKVEQSNGYLGQINGFYPYAQLTFGNFYVEAEGIWGIGTLRSYEAESRPASVGGPTAGANVGANATNVQLNALGMYINAKYDFKPAYVGLQFVYLSGDDNSNVDKVTGGIAGALQANYGFNRSLILWNSDYGDNLGSMYGNQAFDGAASANGKNDYTQSATSGTATTGNLGQAANRANYVNRRTGSTYAVNQFMDNVWFYQIYAGFKPMPKMDLKASFSIASADKAPKSDVGVTGGTGYYTGQTVKEFSSTKYGNELDLTAEYKIYDNLTYMIGMGYLWTGDYFKGYDTATTIKDNYLLTHKLTLNF